MRLHVEPRANAPLSLKLIVSVVAGLAALLLVAIPVLFAGGNPIDAYGLMVKGSFGSLFSLSETLTRATPLILTGLAAAIAFRARLWNIGAEGQLYVGALAAVIVGSGVLQVPPLVMIPIVMIAGFIAGGLMMVVPAFLKQRFGADEVVTTLLLNFVVILFIQMLVEGPLKDPLALGWPQSVPLIDAADYPKLVPRMRIHLGLIVGIAAALILWVVVRRTVLGFEIRAVGENRAAARFAGLPVNATLLKVALISGGLAGLAGVGEVAGVKGYLSADLSPGFGYSGIVVAMLAGLSPIGTVFAAIFVAAVFVGADSMSRATGISNYLADLVVALALLCVLIGGFFLRFRVRIERAAPARAEGSAMDVLADIFLSVHFWAAAVRIATPLIFGVLGALVCERAGVLNLGIEGIFVAGAMSGWMAVWLGADLWTGVLVAMLAGAVFGAIHATLTVLLGLSQHVSGIGVTLLATSLAYSTYRTALPDVSTPPRITPFRPLNIPGLSDLPFIGPVLFQQTSLTIFAFVLVGVVAWVLYRTPLGLAIRAVGDNPTSVEAQGLSVIALRFGAVVAGSALMALGGAFLTMSAFDAFFFGMVNGRGWICIALVVFASWQPGKALLGALLFGAFDAFQIRLQAEIGQVVPGQVFLMLPYLLSILALVLVARKADYPRALLQPWFKGQRH